MFEHFRVFETEFAGKKISFETGKMCCLAGGSVLVRYGETTVLVNATASKKPRDGIDFLPLSVDFEEKLYSVGKIPGSFLKREGRPSDKAILSSRVVDRPIRPLFPKDMRNDVTVVMTVLSVDPDCQPEIAGMIGASFALSISDIPWNGPIAGINIGLVDGEIILTPTAEQRAQSDLTLVVAGTDKKVCMIEAGAKEVADDVMLAAIMKGFAEIQKMVEFIKGVQAEIGKPKFTFESQEVDHDLFEAVKEYAKERVMAALDTDDKNLRDQNLQPIEEDVRAKFDPENERPAVIGECLYKLQKFIVRRWLLEEGKRVDGRKMDEIRPLAAEVGIIPRVHGSGMFTRGQTQVLTRKCLPSPPWAPSRSPSCWTALMGRPPSGICTSITSPPTRWGRPVPAAAPAAGRSATAPWQSGPWSRFFPRWRSSPTPCAWFRRCFPATALPPRAPSAAPPWP